MANTVPASLKSADIARFAHRAAQLEKPKPAVAYWCMPIYRVVGYAADEEQVTTGF